MAQIILSLTPTGLVVESPGLNGVREKLGGLTLHDLPPAIVASLLDQRDKEVLRQQYLKKKEDAQQQLQRKRIFARTLERYPHIGNLVVPDAYLSKAERQAHEKEAAQEEVLRLLRRL